MACLYRRKRSPFWWLEHKKDGVRKLESTGLRYEDELQTAQARLILAAWKAREAKERRVEGRPAISDPSFDWSWLDEWLDSHCKSPKTRSAYDLHWRHIQHWLTVSKIRHPREITYQHGHEYVAWRTGRRANRKTCGKNMALTEVKLLGLILRQCALRGIIEISPIQRLGIARAEADPKRELSDSEIETCLNALDHEQEWMRLRRVSYVTRLYRAAVPVSAAMR
jgi:hypothetical protein